MELPKIIKIILGIALLFLVVRLIIQFLLLPAIVVIAIVAILYWIYKKLTAK